MDTRQQSLDYQATNRYHDPVPGLDGQEAPLRTVLLLWKERFDRFLFWLAETIANIRLESQPPEGKV
jgi:hypothetical protein